VTAVELIVCPYDLGIRDWRCGLGPQRILDFGAVTRLEANGAEVHVSAIETHVDYFCETEMVFEAQRQIATKTASAVARGRFPVVLGGNCNTAVGGICGVGAEECGVIWFDAHGDFCTPETSSDGFVDGMGLAMVVGRCWQNAMSTIPGFHPIPEPATAIVGVRDLDDWEAKDLDESEITCISASTVRSEGIHNPIACFLPGLSSRVAHVYLHIDLDVLDPLLWPANHYNAPVGLEAKDVLTAIKCIGRHVRIAGAGLGSYDPAFDPQGDTAGVAIDLLDALISAKAAE